MQFCIYIDVRWRVSHISFKCFGHADITVPSTLSLLLPCKQFRLHSDCAERIDINSRFIFYLVALHKPLQASLNVLNRFTAFLSCDNHCFISNSLGEGLIAALRSVFESASSVLFVYRLLFSKWKLICNIFVWKGCTWAVVFNIFWRVKYVNTRCHVYRSVWVEDDVARFPSDVFLLPPAFI